MKKVKNTRNTKVSTKKVVVKEAGCSCAMWSWAIYVYWFIILFFIAATFYIIGRSQEFLHPAVNNVVVTEEALLMPQDYIESAKEKINAGDIDAAIVELNAAVDSNANSNVYTLRGEAYMQMGEYQKALADFDSAIEVDGMNALAFYDRALLNTRLENYDVALTDINNALAAQSMKPVETLSLRNLYAKRGQLNLWLKNWQGAVADYTNSLARADGSVVANVYAERAEAYTALGKYEEAIADYTSAVRVISEQIQAASSQEQRESQSSNAMAYFEKSAALNLQLGRKDVAKNDLESAFAIAVALNDSESMERIQNLINGLN
ncbi:MAG: tetratricopeptide repeat protein [Alphaproteobacteria bacterium]|nr:tetratricopeptide repeat protein [Alphaproteobacteria bacterium]